LLKATSDDFIWSERNSFKDRCLGDDVVFGVCISKAKANKSL
jgi:hypothetical protein